MKLSDYILINANYNQQLHEAIENGNYSYVHNFVNTEFSDKNIPRIFSDSFTMEYLQSELITQDHYFNNAYDKGIHIMGM